jgi:hypothetical protein
VLAVSSVMKKLLNKQSGNVNDRLGVKKKYFGIFG